MTRQRHREQAEWEEINFFRHLVEGKISVDEYIKRLDERVRERRENEERPADREGQGAPEPA
jgi:hypothetical protein